MEFGIISLFRKTYERRKMCSEAFKCPRISKLYLLLLLIIQAACQNHGPNGPTFAEPIPNVTVVLSRDASLPCVVENLGDFQVAWLHIDRQMLLTISTHVITRIPRFGVSFDNHKTWTLHVNHVQKRDEGYYMCQINTVPMKSQTGYLKVVVPPNILDSGTSPSHVPIRELSNVNLTCKADGSPEPKIKWQREDNKAIIMERNRKVDVHEGDDLMLYKVNRLQMGAYLCIASNGVPPMVSKRIILDVEFSPTISIPNQLVGAPAGSDVTLDCNVEAYPRSISYWDRSGAMVMNSSKYTTENIEYGFKTRMKLTIHSTESGDYGSYNCFSANSIGKTMGSIRLYEVPNSPSLPPKANEIRTNKNKEEAPVTRNSSRSGPSGRTGNKVKVLDNIKDIFDVAEDILRPSEKQTHASAASISNLPVWRSSTWWLSTSLCLTVSVVFSC